jgi:RNA polymerase sigma-70 factor (ECF subfamily)
MNELAPSWDAVVRVTDPVSEDDFAERVRESSTLAFRVAYGVLRNRQDAEDVAQDAFLRAHRGFAQLRERDRFRAWLVRTTWRLAIDRLRNEKRRAAREQAVEMPPGTTVEEIALARERSRALWAAIDQLPDKLRMTTVLAAIEGHDIADVARLLEIPPGTVKSRLFLARQQLAEKLCSPTKTTSTER